MLKFSNVVTILAISASLFSAGDIRNDVKKVTTSKPIPVHMSRLVNCEDQDIQPCYTYDEGKWRVVYSYAPYKSRAVSVCNSRKSNTPCLSSSTSTSQGVQTKRYFWSKTF